MRAMRQKRIVVAGGGNVGPHFVRALHTNQDAYVSSIPPMSDSGGSTGVLRKLGIQAAGDFRRYAEAHLQGDLKDTWAGILAYRIPHHRSPKHTLTGKYLLRFVCHQVWGNQGWDRFQQILLIGGETLGQVLAYRFPSNFSLEGHTGGNLLYFICEKVWGRQRGHRRFTELLDIKGEVWPASLEDTHLHAMLSNGIELVREDQIDTRNPWDATWISDVWLEPIPKAHIFAVEAIQNADAFVWSAGDALTSIAPIRMVEGILPALKSSSALVLAVINLMTKAAETPHWHAHDFIERMFVHGREREKLDASLVNTGRIPRDVLENYYKREHAERVLYGEEDVAEMEKYSHHVIVGDFLSQKALRQGLIRHDPEIVGDALMAFIRTHRKKRRAWIFDLDDTLAPVPRGSETLITSAINIGFASGAQDVLRAKGSDAFLLTAGPPNLQRMKIEFLKLDEYIPEDQIHIVPTHEEKRRVIQEVVEDAGHPSLVVVVGDRLDVEIAFGNELGCTTVRVCLPGTLRSKEKPRAGQMPTHTITDLRELLDLSFPS